MSSAIQVDDQANNIILNDENILNYNPEQNESEYALKIH